MSILFSQLNALSSLDSSNLISIFVAILVISIQFLLYAVLQLIKVIEKLISLNSKLDVLAAETQKVSQSVFIIGKNQQLIYAQINDIIEHLRKSNSLKKKSTQTKNTEIIDLSNDISIRKDGE